MWRQQPSSPHPVPAWWLAPKWWGFGRCHRTGKGAGQTAHTVDHNGAPSITIVFIVDVPSLSNDRASPDDKNIADRGGLYRAGLFLVPSPPRYPESLSEFTGMLRAIGLRRLPLPPDGWDTAGTINAETARQRLWRTCIGVGVRFAVGAANGASIRVANVQHGISYAHKPQGVRDPPRQATGAWEPK